MDFNHFFFSGNVVRDLELRYLPNGAAVVTYTVANNSFWYDEQEQRRERSVFVPVTTFGKQAERDAKYLRKGSKVFVEGRIESWYQEEKARGGFNFIATNVQYVGRPSDDVRDAGSSAPASPSDGWTAEYEAAEHQLANAAPAGKAAVRRGAKAAAA